MVSQGSGRGGPVPGAVAGFARRAAGLTGEAIEKAATTLGDLGVGPAAAVGAGRRAIAPLVADSPWLNGGTFHNLEPRISGVRPDLGLVTDLVRRAGAPTRQIPVIRPAFTTGGFRPLTRGSRITWLGHATVLIEIDGLRILTDPVFSRRCSPSQLIGPARLHPTPSTIDELPQIDIVLISHDHYDHLDHTSIVALRDRFPDAVFVAPIGVGAHLLAWGVPAGRIRQADWHETVEVGRLHLVCCPARHFSGRGLQRNPTQWASWVVRGPNAAVFFSGDTGYSGHFADVGRRHGPFDLTLVAIGAYDALWPDIHLTPEEAVEVHRMLSPDATLVPIHWATFNLARHAWADPARRLLAAAGDLPVAIPAPGGSVTPGGNRPTELDPWWERCA